MKSVQIRKKFFDFFIKAGHEQVASSSLIPAQDPTLLFANAGMNQFKDLFLGKEVRRYKRAVSIQKCMRAGGKHNDLDNVGFTKRHLTFFEMMGNFSFGDYFKKEAIEFAWQFLTVDLALPKDKLYASVFTDDQESYTLWHTLIGLPEHRIVRLGAADNFWQMGDTGPCGPCTEIYIDRGSNTGCGAKTCAPGCACDRFLEIWNLVFMQFDRQPDGTDVPLKHTGVDTGMGLERLCAVVQQTDSVYQTDLFVPLIAKIEELTGIVYGQSKPEIQAAFHVLADHVRSSTMAIADGAAPSNEGRGYVLRKIIRRAALFEKKLTQKSIFAQLAKTLIAQMGSIYPELVSQEQLIVTILHSEIEKFAVNLMRGQTILQEYLQESAPTKIISGVQTFKLYDTFGFPVELVKLMAQEQGYTVDQAGFEREMEKQQTKSGKKEGDALGHKITLPESVKTEFVGYDHLGNESTVLALIHENQLVEKVPAGQPVYVITQQSPFYVECGGQVSDQGWIDINGCKAALLDLIKINGAIAAKIMAPLDIQVGDLVGSLVDQPARTWAMKNHTATHLLQAALIAILGRTVKQAGSVVSPDYLRFDFTYHENLNPDQIKQVEDLVNQQIMANIALKISYTTYKEATNRGVIAFFGDKYNPEQVRVVEVPTISAELCGGTHVRSTGDIGCFKITEVTALSAGTRRLVAVTGPKAIELFQQSFGVVKSLSQEFKAKPDAVLEAVYKQRDKLKEIQSELKNIKKELWKSQLPTWVNEVKQVGPLPFLFLLLDDMPADQLKEIATQLSQKKAALYFLASNTGERSLYYITVSPEYAQAVDLKKFAGWLTDSCGLRGGGTDMTLQGGGQRLDKSVGQKIESWLHTHLSK